MIVGDARRLVDIVPPITFQSVITSPPYWDLQDYGDKSQIGYGQSLESYLADMQNVFEQCAEITSDDATCWLVVGLVRRQQHVVMLPSLLVERAEQAGWSLREWVTWHKSKSLPYAKHGELRDNTEIALLLSKSTRYKFFLEEIRDPIPASRWWLKYPERYSPEGRRPTNLWNIAIPTQGSWRQGPSHQCPFPDELTFRMLSMTSRPGDAVLDPFAGVGSVPALASEMGRIGVGIDISPQFADRFGDARASAHAWWAVKSGDLAERALRSRVFEDTVLQLRALKFARLLSFELRKMGVPLSFIRVALESGTPSAPYAIVKVSIEVAIECPEYWRSMCEAVVADACKRRPLSKFGIEAEVRVECVTDRYAGEFWYEEGKFWRAPVAGRLPDAAAPHVVAPFVPAVSEVEEWTRAAVPNQFE